MSRTLFPLTLVASLFLGVSFAACGGKTDDPGGSGSGSGSGSGGGSGSSSGSATGSSSGGVSGSSGSSGSSSGGVTPATCAGVCMAIYQLPCGQNQPESECESSCESAEMTAMTNCSSQWNAFLECSAQPGALTCVNGQGAQATGCVPEETALGNCVHPPPPPPPGCESIPTSVTTTCSGSAGPNGPTTYTCSDPNGNTWTATCESGTCSCAYDGKMICTCPSTSGSCCPGTN